MRLYRPGRPGIRWVSLLKVLVCAWWLLLSASPGVALAAPGRQATVPGPQYLSGEVLVGWQPDAQVIPQVPHPKVLAPDASSPERQRAAQVLAERTGLTVLDSQPEYGTARLAVPPGREADEITRLAALPWVRYAELNYRAYATGYPNDPMIGNQWNLRRINAPAAWDVTTGSYSIKVALVDSGIDSSHPEFAGRLLPGYDYVHGDNVPEDDYGHGTHVAGILAAAANNGIGIAGLAPNVRILPLKVLNAAGSGAYSDIALAIRRAADTGVEVINLSLGGPASSSGLADAVTYATDAGALVVAAAGNCAQSVLQCNFVTNPAFYPAAYTQTLSVAATDHFDNWASYSGHRDYVGLAAPGGTPADQVWSTIPNGYGLKYGTSMATPLVSGAAALIWTYLPTATGSQIADILKATADKIGSEPYVGGRNDYFGYGRLNVEQAVRWAYPPSLTPLTDTQHFLLGTPVLQQRVRLPFNNPSSQAAFWQASVVEGVEWMTAFPRSGPATFAAPGILTLQAGPTMLAPGVYTGTVRVTSLYPSGTSFDIPVQLRIASAVSRSFAPIGLRQYQPQDWVDPLSGGLPLNLTNDSASQVSLPFPVRFYGQDYYNLWISDNGLVSFSPPASDQVSGANTCLPTAAAPNNAIYVLWKDWDPALGGQVYVQQPDQNRFVVTWYQVVAADNPNPHSFQLVLMSNGPLWFKYQTVSLGGPGTIGIENYDGTVATQIACDGVGRMAASGDAISLQPDLPW
jgi:thermitase